MGTVLYEVSLTPDIGTLIDIASPFVFLAAVAFAPYWLTLEGKKFDKDVVKGLSIAGVIFMIVWISIAGIGHFNMVKGTVWEYNKGNYETVEGYVENFDPMPYDGGKRESFEINGVKFVYSDYATVSGYHKAKSHGGVIKGDGQHLRIRYIYLDEQYGNVIMYIEQLQE